MSRLPDTKKNKLTYYQKPPGLFLWFVLFLSSCAVSSSYGEKMDEQKHAKSEFCKSGPL